MSVHIHVSHDLRVDDLKSLQDKVRLRGGRLIAYSEVLSAFFISARSFRVRWVASAAERKTAGFPSILITALLGWWAITGPYWSISALIWNSRGGFDVTEPLLRAHPGNPSLLGHAEAIALAASQDSAKRQARTICATLIVLMIGALGYLAWSSSEK